MWRSLKVSLFVAMVLLCVGVQLVNAEGVLLNWSSPTTRTLWSVHMVGADDGWAAGEDGTIIRWDGTEWSTETSPTTSWLWSVHMVSASDGWAVGQGGKIIRWDGAEWSVETSPTTETLYDVHMVSASEGWAVGFDGTIIQWTETIPVSGTFEVTVDVMWSDETPVSDANVVIRDSDGQALKNGVTDTNGIFTTSLNEGEYTIEVSKGTLSDSKNVTVDSETVIPFTFDASLTRYTLTVNVVGYDGSIIDGALVEVKLDGTTVASSETGGNTVFELVEGTYQIVVTWNNEQKEETIELTEDREYSIVIWNNEQNEEGAEKETIEITEDREDPITVQKEISFDLILYLTAILAVSATICVLALYLRKRRQRMFPFYGLHP